MSALPNGTHIHRLIRATAIELAAGVYDELAKRNEWYDLHKRKFPNVSDPNQLMLLWVDEHWADMSEDARRMLVEMLTRNDVTEEQKEEIHAALTKDQRFREGRRKASFRKLAKMTRVLE